LFLGEEVEGVGVRGRLYNTVMMIIMVVARKRHSGFFVKVICWVILSREFFAW
jgi:hypothetical protein